MISVIGYIRVSTKEQADRGHSLDGQRLQIREYAKRTGLKIRKWFSDESSARNEEEASERPGFKEACDLATKNGWPIIVVDPSRFSRSEGSFERFVAEGGKVYDVLTGFGADEAVMRAKIQRAKRDGDIRSKATSDGQKKAKAAGKKFGTPIPSKGAAASAASRRKDAAIRKGELERLRDEAAKFGVTEAKHFADWLNDKRYLTAKGKRWTAGSVRERLRERPIVNGVSEPPIPIEADPVAQGTELVTLSREEAAMVRDVMSRAPLSETARSYWLDRIERPLPRWARDRLLAKSRAFLDREAKRWAIPEEYKNNPNWGLF